MKLLRKEARMLCKWKGLRTPVLLYLPIPRFFRQENARISFWPGLVLIVFFTKKSRNYHILYRELAHYIPGLLGEKLPWSKN